jgi:hypothetical protein
MPGYFLSPPSRPQYPPGKFFTHNSALLIDVNPIFAITPDTCSNPVIFKGQAADDLHLPSLPGYNEIALLGLRLKCSPRRANC